MPKIHIHVVNDKTIKLTNLLERPDATSQAAAHALALELMTDDESFYGEGHQIQENGNVILNYNPDPNAIDPSYSLSVIICPDGVKKLAWAKNVRCIVIRHNNPENPSEAQGVWAAHIFGGDQTKVRTYGDMQWGLVPEQLALAKIYNPTLVSADDLAKYSKGLGGVCEQRFSFIKKQLLEKTRIEMSKPFFTDEETAKSMLTLSVEDAIEMAKQHSFLTIPVPFSTTNRDMRIVFEDKDPAKQQFSKCRVAYNIDSTGKISITSGEEADFFVLTIQNNMPQILRIKASGQERPPEILFFDKNEESRFEIKIMNCKEMCEQFVDPSIVEAKRIVAANQPETPDQNKGGRE